MLFYIITFTLGILIDFLKKNQTTRFVINIYIVWLFVFLCFGYMTGSDWRAYEFEFDNLSGDLTSFKYDIGFYSLFYLLKILCSDFFVVIGLLKCFYLFTLIRLIKEITTYWCTTISILMPMSLLFMLVDNPLRYMVALTLINLAIYYLLKKKHILSIVFLITALFFHSTTLIIILLFPFIIKNIFVKIKSRWLFIMFIIICYLCSSTGPVEALFLFALDKFIILGAKDYSSYLVESNEAFFTIGSFLNIFLFVLVLLFRRTIVENVPNGEKLFSVTILYFFLFRLLIIVPTGFRLAIPFGYFAAIYYAALIHSRNFIKFFLSLYFVAVMSKDIYTAYTYIPYTNSIPYIVMGHKPYSQRSNNNLIEYQKRTGKNIY